MIEERDFSWTADIEPDIVLDNVRAAVFGDIPACVLTSDGRRAKGSDIGKIKDELASALTEADGFNMIGYSVVFNQWARINDHEGEYLERVVPGATAKTIRERGDRIVVQFDHGHHPLVGSIPVASPRAVWEDDNGLFGWDRLHRSWLFEPVREAIQSRAIKGQSFRFSVPEAGQSWSNPGRDGLRRRDLTELTIYERGPVVWPAYAGTEVAVRALARAMPDDLRRAVTEERGTLPTDSTGESAAQVGTDDPAAASNGPAPRVTRRDVQRMALPVIYGVTNEQASGDAA